MNRNLLSETQVLSSLPASDKHHAPVTLDGNGKVRVRAKGETDAQATELVLTGSHTEGDPVVASTRREYLARALQLGFDHFQLQGDDKPLFCADSNRH